MSGTVEKITPSGRIRPFGDENPNVVRAIKLQKIQQVSSSSTDSRRNNYSKTHAADAANATETAAVRQRRISRR